jgi:serine/threonine protein kinase/Flp pilus assembly protein TadD
MHPAQDLADSWVESHGKGPVPALHLYAPAPHSSWSEQGPPAFPLCGDTFLGFRLVAELGRGAFGRVYLARQDDLAQRLVALKVSADAQAESHNLAQLQHTHIVPIHSIHRAGRLQAVCMPYFGSTTLRDVLRDLNSRNAARASGKGLVGTIQERRSRTRLNLDRDSAGKGCELPLAVAPSASLTRPGETAATLRMLEGLTYVDAVLWIGECLAQGLAHAHERGIVHRDLKPANVLLTDDGQPMLLDFNLSADTKVDADPARVGGTLPYMAPEHLASFAGLPAPFPGDRSQESGVRGQESGAGSALTPAVVDARSDVYSLGIILHELITGRAPFEQPSGPFRDLVPKMIRARLGRPPRLRPRSGRVSPAVDSILAHCLEPDPARRYQSARQLVEDLQCQRTHRPLMHARERSLRERAVKWVRRNRRATVLGAAVCAVALILGLTGGLLGYAGHLGRLEAVATLSAFDDECDQARLLLASRPDDTEQRRDGLRFARAALARYDLPDRAAWGDQSAVRRLPAVDRQRLRPAVGELLLLVAAAETADQQAPLLERAADCFAEDDAPRALYVQRADLARRRGDRDEARAWQQRAELQPPRSALDHYLLAREQLDRGQSVEAALSLREAVRLDPKHFAAWFLLGQCCLDTVPDASIVPRQSETEAVHCFTVCRDLRPAFHGAYYNRGLARLRLKQYPEAEADFSAALARRPSLTDAYLHRGLARESQAKYPEALADFTRSLEAGDAATRAWFARARVRRRLGDPGGAAQDEQEGLRRPPRDHESLIHRGVVRAATDPRRALVDFQEAVRRNPRSVAGRYNQAYILAERLEQPRQALALLDEVVRLCPHLTTPRASRGLLRARLGQRDAAHEDAREIQARAAGNSEVVFQAACIHAQTARFHPADRDEAFRLLAQALRAGFGHDRLERDRDLAPLRQDSRFAQVVQAVQMLRMGGDQRRQ